MAALRDFLKPDLEQAPRPDPQTSPDGVRYTRAFLWMRLGVGVLGVLLPVTLIALDWLVFDGHPFVRDSMSAYYYSGMREFFVGAIFGSGAFLLAYKVSEVSLDNTASIGAGISAWFIAIFATGPAAASGASEAAAAAVESAPGPDRGALGYRDSLRRIGRLHHLPGSGGCALRHPRGEVAAGAAEAPAAVLARLPLHLCCFHGPWCGLDRRHLARRQRAALVDPLGRMGVHLGLGTLMAREGRGVGHALRSASPRPSRQLANSTRSDRLPRSPQRGTTGLGERQLAA